MSFILSYTLSAQHGAWPVEGLNGRSGGEQMSE